MDDAELATLLDVDGTPGWGFTRAVTIDGIRVFTKSVPVTALELAHPGATHNLHELPALYSYGVGSAGFGVFRELALRLTHRQTADWNPALTAHATALMLSEIHAMNVQPMQIRMPQDPRLRKVCRALLDDPASPRTCSQWGDVAGASARTLERLFRKEMQLSFGLWRRQVRLLEAMDRLAAGTPVTSVALDLGYRSPSAFTVMFKRALDCLPSEMYD